MSYRFGTRADRVVIHSNPAGQETVQLEADRRMTYRIAVIGGDGGAAAL